MNKTLVLEYTGFESLNDLDEDLMDNIGLIIPHGEFLGTVKITMEYIPSEDEE